MPLFEPIIETVTNVNKTMASLARGRLFKPEEIDFDLLSYQTYFKVKTHDDWTLLDTHLEALFDDKIIRSKEFELHQEYEIRIRPYDKSLVLSSLNISIAANKLMHKVVAIIKPQSYFPCATDVSKLVKDTIYKRKLRSGLLIGVFEEGLDEAIASLVQNHPCETPLEDEIRLNIGISPSPKSPIHTSVIYHYDRKEKRDNKLMDGVFDNELIIEYIKAKKGKNGRSCNGKFLQVRNPSFRELGYSIDLKTIEIVEDDDSIKYFAKIPGYVLIDNGVISISKNLALEKASFKKTGSIDPGMDKDIILDIRSNLSSEDAVGSGVSIDVHEVNIKGTVGANTNIQANELNVGEQTHRNSALNAAEHAKVKLHRGKLKAKTAEIDILENGSVVADEIHVKKMLGGELIGHTIKVDELISNGRIIALKSIEITSIVGKNNKLIIDPDRIENYHEKIEHLKEELSLGNESFKVAQLELVHKHTNHKNLAPRIKKIHKKVIEATKASRAPLKSDIARIKQYKQNTNALKVLAEDLKTREALIHNIKQELEKLYEADLHATISYNESYDGQTQIIFIDTKTSQEYTFYPTTTYPHIFLEKTDDEKKIAWKDEI
ncbi:MAG: flagellar assembly protein A [Campylobacterota bacterium]|nr:flagellar assembly protein A [Campylobacterota bacterium]